MRVRHNCICLFLRGKCFYYHGKSTYSFFAYRIKDRPKVVSQQSSRVFFSAWLRLRTFLILEVENEKHKEVGSCNVGLFTYNLVNCLRIS